MEGFKAPLILGQKWGWGFKKRQKIEKKRQKVKKSGEKSGEKSGKRRKIEKKVTKNVQICTPDTRTISNVKMGKL